MFLDGVGLAEAGPDNPLADAPTPTLRALLGGPLTLEQVQQRPDLLLRPIDATLGVAGLPQSGTGHTALLAGVNAPQLHGRHQPHFPPVALRPLLATNSLFHRVRAAGGAVAFANAFGPGYWDAVETRQIRKSASVIAAEGAGLRFRDLDDLRAGYALSWDITGAAMRGRPEWPLVPPERAGQQLARLADDHALVFFECFLPDLVGHGRTGPGDLRMLLHAAWATIDGCLAGLLAARRPQDTLLLTSDHGNSESLAAPTHTRNPVPLLAVGPASARFAAVADISQVADAVVTTL